MKKVLLMLFISVLSISVYAQSDYNKTQSGHSDLTIYPNPALEYISIDDMQETINQVVVFNLIGRKVKSFYASPQKKYVISELPKGMYMVQLLDKNNKVVTTQRVSKR